MAFTYDNLITELSNFGTQWLIGRTDASNTGSVGGSSYAGTSDIFSNNYWMSTSSAIDGKIPSNPTTPVACSSATVGALQLKNSSNRITIIGMDGEFRPNSTSTTSYQETMPVIICDRLSHQAGLSANVSGTQSTNLPTAALTRYTNGVGVMIGMANYDTNNAGATSSLVTASYTNSDGISGRTTTAVAISGRSANRNFFLPLQSGDVGVKSVESITLTAATGTAGNFGIFLFKPLAIFMQSYSGPSAFTMPTGGLMGGLPKVENDACLFFMILTATQYTTANLIVTEV